MLHNWQRIWAEPAKIQGELLLEYASQCYEWGSTVCYKHFPFLIHMSRKINNIRWRLTYRFQYQNMLEEVNNHFRLSWWMKSQNSIRLMDKVVCKYFLKWMLTVTGYQKMSIMGKMTRRISWSFPRTHWIYLKTWENQFLPNYNFPFLTYIHFVIFLYLEVTFCCSFVGWRCVLYGSMSGGGGEEV